MEMWSLPHNVDMGSLHHLWHEPHVRRSHPLGEWVEIGFHYRSPLCISCIMSDRYVPQILKWCRFPDVYGTDNCPDYRGVLIWVVEKCTNMVHMYLGQEEKRPVFWGVIISGDYKTVLKVVRVTDSTHLQRGIQGSLPQPLSTGSSHLKLGSTSTIPMAWCSLSRGEKTL